MPRRGEYQITDSVLDRVAARLLSDPALSITEACDGVMDRSSFNRRMQRTTDKRETLRKIKRSRTYSTLNRWNT